MIQSRHSRRRVPISLSQSELACGLRTGVVITLRPSRVSEASKFGGKDRVVVVDDETILVVEWDGLSQLLQSPRGGGGMGRRIEVNQST